jgi:hypothetical protein
VDLYRVLGGVMVGALASYFWVRAPRLAHDESVSLLGGRHERGRAVSYRIGAIFLAGVAAALVISGFA